MSGYPPGVSGQEWEIAGYPPCGHMGCGHDDGLHAEGEPGPCEVTGCECEGYTPYSDHDEYEPDLEVGL